MEIATRDNGLTIRPMDTEHTLIRMEPSTRANGNRINKMERVHKSGLTASTMKDSIKTELNQAKVCLNSWMEAIIKELFSTTKFMVKVIILTI